MLALEHMNLGYILAEIFLYLSPGDLHTSRQVIPHTTLPFLVLKGTPAPPPSFSSLQPPSYFNSLQPTLSYFNFLKLPPPPLI